MQLPKEFEERMKNIIPNYDKFLEENEKENIKGIKVNTNKISTRDFIKIFPYKIEQIPYTCDSFYLKENVKLGNHPYHHAGLFYSQDPGASAPINGVNIKDDYRVLDLCAAPGGKSIQVASKLKNGFLISNEINSKRAQILYSNIERMGLTNVIVTNDTPESFRNAINGYFDLVIVDAPCSGEGMFRKNWEAINEWSLENVELCSKRQKEILECVAHLPKTNGYILYSTCTYEKCENEDIVEWFTKNYNYEVVDLKNLDNYTVNGLKPIEKAKRFYPHISLGEGQFMCLMQNRNIEKEYISIKKQNDLGKEDTKIVNDFMENLTIKLDLKIQNNKVFAPLNVIPDNIHIISSGVQVGEIKGNYLLPNHYLFKAYGNYFKNKCNLKLNDKRVLKYLKGEEIIADVPNGWGVLMVDGYPIGGYKATNGKLKNHYPKGLRNVC